MIVVTFILMLLCMCVEKAQTFSSLSPQSGRFGHSPFSLTMGSGKSQRLEQQVVVDGAGVQEQTQKQTQRHIFKDLRAKLNEVAAQPGFFDTKDKDALLVELYCKSNSDGTQIGSCPESQFVQMVMLKKGLSYTVRPVTSAAALPEAISQALPQKQKGKGKGKGVSGLPVLRHKGEVVTDALAIAEFIERTYPHSSLTRQGVHSYQEVLERTSAFFPTVTAWIVNKDASKEATLQADTEAALDQLDELIRTTPGKFICGIEMTLADLLLAPQLYHAMAALEHFKDYQFYHISGTPSRPALEHYMSRLFDLEEFNDKKAYYNVDAVISGWKLQRGAV